MSHELRTPLTAIIGFADAMRMNVFGDIGNVRYRDYIEHIHTSGQHLLSLINDILDLSKIEAGKMEVTRTPVHLGEICLMALTMMTECFASANLTLDADLPPDLPPVAGDDRRLLQVFLNLLSNAVKFTPEGGSVTMTGRARGGQIEIAVKDTGIGMEADKIPLALEAFGQIDNSLSRANRGTGLGLPLARQLVELHGGWLDVLSAPGRGTTITVTLPIAEPLPSGAC